MSIKVFQNEFDAWKEAQQTTKRYFMITEEISGIGKSTPDSVYYITTTKDDLTSWLLEKADHPNTQNILTRIYSRKADYSFIEDITNVNNKFQFVGQC